jgi:aminoglycoside phosphotransferase (APT) family kinase protein
MIEGIDHKALSIWMDSAGLPPGPIHNAVRLNGGSQNLLVRFRRGGEAYVLRRPPLEKRANSDDTMMREARVLRALAGSPVPHPRLIAACSDTSVLGAAFYLTEVVQGTNPTLGLPPLYLDNESWRWELGLAVADGAAAIGAVDYVAAGLGDLGRVEGYLERQVSRWRSQLDSYSQFAGYTDAPLTAVDAVSAWLESNRPRSWRPGLIHGDYHLANVLCANDRPALAAIVDWELTTLGDPLLDLGWLLATWPDTDDPIIASVAVKPWAGFPEKPDLIARYAERSGRDLSAIGWYEVLACYKLGIILEGTHARACAGLVDRYTGDMLHTSYLRLFDHALARIGSS